MLGAYKKHPQARYKMYIPVHFIPTCLQDKHAAAWNHGHPRPKMNILVHFWAASLQPNWLLFRTSGIRAASATLRINLCVARSSCTLSVSLLK